MPIFYLDHELGADATTATPLGWWSVAFNNGSGLAPSEGDACTGATSGHHGHLTVVGTITGSWAGNNAAGVLYFYGCDDLFHSGEQIDWHDGHCHATANAVYCAWKTLTTGATAARIAPGDTIRCKKLGSTPTKLSGATGKATWVNQQKYITLAEAQTINIDRCETAWTKNASGDTTVTRTAKATWAREGDYCMKLALDSSPQANIMQAYYATGDLTLSAYNRISFSYTPYSGASLHIDNYLIALCSDTAGLVPVDMFRLPVISVYAAWSAITLEREYSVAFTGGTGTAPAAGSTITGATSLSTAVVIKSTLASGTWAGGDAAGVMFVHTRSAAFVSEQVDQGANHFHITTDFARGNIGSSTIKSIALYTGNNVTSIGSRYIYVDNFLAANSTGLNLNSLISKDSAEIFSDDDDGWYPIQSINDTIVYIDGYASNSSQEGPNYYSAIASELVDTYIREGYKAPVLVGTSTTYESIQDSGTVSNVITISGGWSPLTNEQDGETIIDLIQSGGIGIQGSSSGTSHIYIERFSFVRANTGFKTTGQMFSGIFRNTVGCYVAIEDGGDINHIPKIHNCNCNYRALYFSGCNGTYDYILAKCCFSAIGFISTNPGSLKIYELYLYGCISAGLAFRNSNNIVYKAEIYYTYEGSAITGSGDCACRIKYLDVQNNDYTTNFANSYNNGYLYVDRLESSGYAAIYSNQAYCLQQTAVAGGTGLEWYAYVSHTIYRSEVVPFEFIIARIFIPVANINKEVTFSIYVKKDSTQIAAFIKCEKGQLAGLTTEEKTMCPNDTNRNLLTLTFTPTESGMVEIKGGAYSVTSVGGATFDDITISVEA